MTFYLLRVNNIHYSYSCTLLTFEGKTLIAETPCSCPNLKRLYLNSNCLVTLPEAIHFITESLDELQLDDNPDMIWPPKPRGLAMGSGAQFYNIDFSLQTQLSRAGAQNAATLAAGHGAGNAET